MQTSRRRIEHRRQTRRTVAQIFAVVLTVVQTLSATTYISVEPIPNRDIVGDSHLTRLRSIGYSRLARWSERLLSECFVVDNVIEALAAHGAITSVTPVNTRVVVAAGGFEGATNPSYVFTVQDVGSGAASMRDIDVLVEDGATQPFQDGDVIRKAGPLTIGKAPGTYVLDEA